MLFLLSTWASGQCRLHLKLHLFLKCSNVSDTSHGPVILVCLFFSVSQGKKTKQPCQRKSPEAQTHVLKVASAAGVQTVMSGRARNAPGALATARVQGGWRWKGQRSWVCGQHPVQGGAERESVAAALLGKHWCLQTLMKSVGRRYPVGLCGRSFRMLWASVFLCALTITTITITTILRAPQDPSQCSSGPNGRSMSLSSCRTNVPSHPNLNWLDVGTL